jgi:hypothetical protein
MARPDNVKGEQTQPCLRSFGRSNDLLAIDIFLALK